MARHLIIPALFGEGLEAVVAWAKDLTNVLQQVEESPAEIEDHDILAGAVTSVSQTYTTGAVSESVAATWLEIQSAVLQTTGQPVLVMVSAVVKLTTASGGVTGTFRLQADGSDLVAEEEFLISAGTAYGVLALQFWHDEAKDEYTYDLDVRFSQDSGAGGAIEVTRRSLIALEIKK